MHRLQSRGQLSLKSQQHYHRYDIGVMRMQAGFEGSFRNPCVWYLLDLGSHDSRFGDVRKNSPRPRSSRYRIGGRKLP